MKKLLTFLATVTLILVFSPMVTIASDINKIFDAGVSSRRLREGTNLRFKLLNKLDTDIIMPGHEFQAALCDDIKVNGKLLLPKGTVVRGTVNSIQDKKRLSKSAVMYIKFDHIVTPGGRQLPLRASLFNQPNITPDGGIDGGGTYRNEFKRTCDKSSYIMKNVIDWGESSGDNIFDGWGKIVTYPIAYIGAGIGGAGYLVGDAFLDIFRKGHNAVLKDGDILEILLTRPIDIPTY